MKIRSLLDLPDWYEWFMVIVIVAFFLAVMGGAFWFGSYGGW